MSRNKEKRTMKTLRWLALVTLAVATPAAGQEEEIVLISDMAIDGHVGVGACVRHAIRAA